LGITSRPDGNLWFTGENSIGRITPGGIITEFPLSPSNGRLESITSGPDSNLWFTEGNGNKIGRMSMSNSV
jgi:virginiamycin B lyase